MRDDGPTADEPKAYSGGREAGSSRSNPFILGADPAFIILCLPLSGFQPYVGMRYEAIRSTIPYIVVSVKDGHILTPLKGKCGF